MQNVVADRLKLDAVIGMIERRSATERPQSRWPALVSSIANFNHLKTEEQVDER